MAPFPLSPSTISMPFQPAAFSSLSPFPLSPCVVGVSLSAFRPFLRHLLTSFLSLLSLAACLPPAAILGSPEFFSLLLSIPGPFGGFERLFFSAYFFVFSFYVCLVKCNGERVWWYVFTSSRTNAIAKGFDMGWSVIVHGRGSSPSFGFFLAPSNAFPFTNKFGVTL